MYTDKIDLDKIANSFITGSERKRTYFGHTILYLLNDIINNSFNFIEKVYYVTVSDKTQRMGSLCTICTMRDFSTPIIKMLKLSFCRIHAKEPFSTNLCHRLRRPTASYKGEIDLRFYLPSLYSCRTWSPSLWVLIRILYLDIARFITSVHLLTFLPTWASKNN